MTSPSDSCAKSYLDVSAGIAVRLCNAAYESAGRCVWLRVEQAGDDDRASFRHLPTGADLYNGTSGIALFLAEEHIHSKSVEGARIAVAGISQALDVMETIPPLVRMGFYSGVPGVAYAAVRIAHLVGRDDLRDRAKEALAQLLRQNDQPILLDVISGAAGAITPLLSLARELEDVRVREFAYGLGRRIVQSAVRTDAGWSWDSSATGIPSKKGLTGFGHGSAGIGWALFELYAEFGDTTFLTGAREAFRYEDSEFDASCGNWPDYRYADGNQSSAPGGVAWCLGAPGIGMSRVRANEIAPSGQYVRDCDAVTRVIDASLAMAQCPEGDDFSLCHGWSGVAEFLLLRANRGDALATSMLNRIARAGLESAVDSSWGCGVAGHSTPSLMLGLSGIGYFFLRLADASVPSVLMFGDRTNKTSADRYTGSPCRVSAACLPQPSG